MSESKQSTSSSSSKQTDSKSSFNPSSNASSSDEEDDSNFLTILPSTAPSKSPTKVPSMNMKQSSLLSLNLPTTTSSSTESKGSSGDGENTEESYLKQTHNTPITITFELPDSSTVDSTFKMGQTIEVLKAFLFDEVGVDMREVCLSCEANEREGKRVLLLDPMSLLDYADFFKDGEGYVIVDGDINDGGRK